MAILTHLAKAKVNLWLEVTGKRDDGYHILDSLVAFADIGDRISVRPAPHFTLSCDGLFAQHLPPAQENIIWKIAHHLHHTHNIAKENQAHIHMHKALPVASGIGGGSSDAATAAQLLCQLWRIPTTTLAQELLPFGADIPVCLHERTMHMQGIGEQLTPVKHAPMPALCIHPGVAVSTQQVFAQLHPPFMAATQSDAIAARRNDLQPTAIALAPEIATVLETLTHTEGCQLARMSGSGATCFGLFSTAKETQTAAKILAATHPNWWIQPTILG